MVLDEIKRDGVFLHDAKCEDYIHVPSVSCGTWRRHQTLNNCRVKVKPVLGELHHEYSLEKKAA